MTETPTGWNDDDLPMTGKVLNLGAGLRIVPEHINVDYVEGPGIDVVTNLEKPWPWSDNEIDFIEAHDVLEHMRICYEEPEPFFIAETHKALAQGDVVTAVAALLRAVENPRRHYGIVHFMNEAFRVLKPGGKLRITSPDTRGLAWCQDPTHTSFINENTFFYFTSEDWRRTHGSLISARFEYVYGLKSAITENKLSWVRVKLMKPF